MDILYHNLSYTTIILFLSVLCIHKNHHRIRISLYKKKETIIDYICQLKSLVLIEFNIIARSLFMIGQLLSLMRVLLDNSVP